MATLPSYQEATARADWLHLVAPYVLFSDYRSLCLVNHHFWSIFAPRLWGNLFRAARNSGVDPLDDLDWWLNFVFKKLDSITPATRALVRILDARAFCKEAAYHFAWNQPERTLQRSFKLALEKLPSVESLLLDAHSDLDAHLLLSPPEQLPETRLRLLSLDGCPTQLPNNFFQSPTLQGLVYLDVSGISGALWSLIHRSRLPDLRILKIRSREVDDSTLLELTSTFRLRLWSLDLSDNKITDAAIPNFGSKCFPCATLRSEAHFRVEGKLMHSSHGGMLEYGPFFFIQESDWSGKFCHPERYLLDTPMYHLRSLTDSAGNTVERCNGSSSLRQDSASATVESLLQNDGALPTEDSLGSQGITHLRLSRNTISSFGIGKLFRLSNGQIEDFSCDSMPLFPKLNLSTKLWLKSTKLSGMVGLEFVLRPVYACNLRVLKIHHSLVTNVLGLRMDGASSLANAFMAERLISPRLDKAFPLGYIPDMNPRLRHLTLTDIPQYSSGPLITKLTTFLRLLSIQEGEVHQASMIASSRRGPGVLSGIQKLVLEFEPDSQGSFSEESTLDAEDLLNSGDVGFSFFDHDRPTRPPKSTARRHSTQSPVKNEASQSSTPEAYVISEGHWDGQKVMVPVWTGAKEKSPSSMIKEYCRMIFNYGIRDGVGPVTPSQVQAGAPPDTFIFHTAWLLAALPDDLTAPNRSDLGMMMNVQEEIERFRIATKSNFLRERSQGGQAFVAPGAPHFFWGGKLVMTTTASSSTHVGHHWR